MHQFIKRIKGPYVTPYIIFLISKALQLLHFIAKRAVYNPLEVSLGNTPIEEIYYTYMLIM